jgi:hypothetical protein
MCDGTGGFDVDRMDENQARGTRYSGRGVLRRAENVSAKLRSLVTLEVRHAIKIRADAKFWRHWHGNKRQMRRIGYRCRKAGDRWHAERSRMYFCNAA